MPSKRKGDPRVPKGKRALDRKLDPKVVRKCEGVFWNDMVHAMDRLCRTTERDMLDYMSAAQSTEGKEGSAE